MNAAWVAPPPCKPGDSIQDVLTPALLVDLDMLDRNLTLMAKLMERWPKVALRPHAKAHKCPALGALQVCILYMCMRIMLLYIPPWWVLSSML